MLYNSDHYGVAGLKVTFLYFLVAFYAFTYLTRPFLVIYSKLFRGVTTKEPPSQFVRYPQCIYPSSAYVVQGVQCPFCLTEPKDFRELLLFSVSQRWVIWCEYSICTPFALVFCLWRLGTNQSHKYVTIRSETKLR